MAGRDASLLAAIDGGAVVALAVLGALVLVVLVGLLAAWWTAWEPARLLCWRHAVDEAGWRVGAAWAEFTDWVRFGR